MCRFIYWRWYLEKDIPPRSNGYVKGKHSYIIYAINIIIIFKKMSIEAHEYILHAEILKFISFYIKLPHSFSPTFFSPFIKVSLVSLFFLNVEFL